MKDKIGSLSGPSRQDAGAPRFTALFNSSALQNMRLKEFQLDGEIFLGVLAEILDHLGAFGGEIVEIVVQAVVGNELSEGALAALRAIKNIIQLAQAGPHLG